MQRTYDRPDTTLPKLAAILSFASVLTNLAAFAIGTSRGLVPPTAFDFGSDFDLRRLSAEHTAHLLPLALSLLSPVLAIPVGLGWFHILRRAGWPALSGMVLFVVGMIFVVLLDVVELVVIAKFAPAYGGASEAAKPVLLAIGSTLETTRAVLAYVGHFFSFGLAQLAWGVAILKVPTLPRWLAWLAFAPAVTIGWLATALELAGRSGGPLVPIGIVTFFVWFLSMAVVLFRWTPEAGAGESRLAI